MRASIWMSLAVVAMLAGGVRGQGVELTSLKPAAVEWGTEKHDLFPDMQYGPRVCDYMSAGNQGFPWKEDLKIVKQLKLGQRMPTNTVYNSAMNDMFVVGGEFMTGVGLLARRMSFYYWIDYAVPPMSKTFTVALYVTDDARGYMWWGTANQQFTFQVLVDGQEMAHVDGQRLQMEAGGGEKLKDIAITLPKGAKTIRFRLVNSGWGDGNANTELLLHKGRFAR